MDAFDTYMKQAERLQFTGEDITKYVQQCMERDERQKVREEREREKEREEREREKEREEKQRERAAQK